MLAFFKKKMDEVQRKIQDVSLGEKAEKPYYGELGMLNLRGWYLNQNEESLE